MADKGNSLIQKEGTPESFGILIVASKMDVRSFYTSALNKSGEFNVTASVTGKEALSMLASPDQPFEIKCLLIDWDLEDYPGYMFLQKVRGNPRNDKIDVVVASNTLKERDTFLLAEMDVRHVIKQGGNAGELLSKIELVRAEYKKYEPVLKNITELQQALLLEDADACIRVLEKPGMLALIKEGHRFFHYFGEVLILKKEYDTAITSIQDYLRNGQPEKSETLKILNTLGRALCLTGKYHEALVVYERLAGKSPQNLTHMSSLGDALLGLDLVEDARTKYEQVLNLDPENKNALVGMGKVSVTEGDTVAAKSFFDQIKEPYESAGLASFFNNTGVALVRAGKSTEGIQFYKNALPFLDKYRGHIYFNMGMAYLRDKHSALAVECFKEVLHSGSKDLIEKKSVLREMKEQGVEEFVANYAAKNFNSDAD